MKFDYQSQLCHTIRGEIRKYINMSFQQANLRSHLQISSKIIYIETNTDCSYNSSTAITVSVIKVLFICDSTLIFMLKHNNVQIIKRSYTLNMTTVALQNLVFVVDSQFQLYTQTEVCKVKYTYKGISELSLHQTQREVPI